RVEEVEARLPLRVGVAADTRDRDEPADLLRVAPHLFQPAAPDAELDPLHAVVLGPLRFIAHRVARQQAELHSNLHRFLLPFSRVSSPAAAGPPAAAPGSGAGPGKKAG